MVHYFEVWWYYLGVWWLDFDVWWFELWCCDMMVWYCDGKMQLEAWIVCIAYVTQDGILNFGELQICMTPGSWFFFLTLSWIVSDVTQEVLVLSFAPRQRVLDRLGWWMCDNVINTDLES
jgi:hypothetical protein